jgi:hypothetical protein
MLDHTGGDFAALAEITTAIQCGLRRTSMLSSTVTRTARASRRRPLPTSRHRGEPDAGAGTLRRLPGWIPGTDQSVIGRCPLAAMVGRRSITA